MMETLEFAAFRHRSIIVFQFALEGIPPKDEYDVIVPEKIDIEGISLAFMYYEFISRSELSFGCRNPG